MISFTPLFAFTWLTLTLIKDIVKGYADNKYDIYLDIILLSAGLPIFIKSFQDLINCKKNRYKMMKVHLIKYFLLGFGERYYRRLLVIGKGVFCNQAHTEPEVYQTNFHFIFNDLEYYPNEVEWKYHSLEFMKGFGSMDTRNMNSLILGENFISLFPDNIKCIFDGEEYSLYNVNENGASELKLIYSKRDCRLESYKLSVLLYLHSIAINHFRIGELIVKNDKNLTIKHENDDYECVIIKNLDDWQNVIFYFCLSYWSENDQMGILSNLPQEGNKRRGVNVCHCLNMFEIIERCKMGYRPKVVRDFSDEQFITEGIVSDIEESIEDHDFYIYQTGLLEKIYGYQLARFFIDYIEVYFGFKNSSAVKFLCERNSLRNIHRCVDGGNWKAKRFGIDVCYILECAGLPSMTHVDKSISPTIRVRNLTSSIPKSPMIIDRKILEYNLKEKEELFAEKSIKVKSKEISGKEFSLFANEIKGLRKHNEHMYDKKAFKDSNGNTNNKLTTIVWKSITEKFKTVKQTNRFEDLITKERVRSSNLPTYCSTLKKNLNREKIEDNICKVNTNKTLVKIIEFKENIKSYNELPKLKEVKENLSVHFTKAKGKHVFRKYDLKNNDCEIHLENFFNSLDNYIEEVEDKYEKRKEAFNKDDYKEIANMVYENTKMKSNLRSKKLLNIILSVTDHRNKHKISKKIKDEIYNTPLSISRFFVDSDLIYQKVKENCFCPRVLIIDAEKKFKKVKWFQKRKDALRFSRLSKLERDIPCIDKFTGVKRRISSDLELPIKKISRGVYYPSFVRGF